jgi:hypothetical protein
MKESLLVLERLRANEKKLKDEQRVINS